MEATSEPRTIHGEYQMTTAEWMRVGPSMWRSVVLYLAGGLLVLFGLLTAWVGIAMRDPASLAIGPVMTLFGLGVASGWIFLPRLWLRMRGRKHVYEAHVVVDATPDEIRMTADYGSSVMSWSALLPGLETKTMFILSGTTPIPKRAFSVTDVAAFRRLLREKGLLESSEPD
jgi:hypothetical protein